MPNRLHLSTDLAGVQLLGGFGVTFRAWVPDSNAHAGMPELQAALAGRLALTVDTGSASITASPTPQQARSLAAMLSRVADAMDAHNEARQREAMGIEA